MSDKASRLKCICGGNFFSYRHTLDDKFDVLHIDCKKCHNQITFSIPKIEKDITQCIDFIRNSLKQLKKVKALSIFIEVGKKCPSQS